MSEESDAAIWAEIYRVIEAIIGGQAKTRDRSLMWALVDCARLGVIPPRTVLRGLRSISKRFPAEPDDV